MAKKQETNDRNKQSPTATTKEMLEVKNKKPSSRQRRKNKKKRAQKAALNIEANEVIEVKKPIEQGYEGHIPFFIVVMFLIQNTIFYNVDGDWLVMTLGYDPTRRHEIWRFLTLFLAHSCFFDLWMHMAWQAYFSFFLETVYGWKKVAIIYFVSIFGGSMFISILEMKSYVIGSNNAYAGLLGAHIAHVILNWRRMKDKAYRLSPIFSNIAYVALTNYYTRDLGLQYRICLPAQIGGCVFGLCTGVLLFKKRRDHLWKRILRYSCVIIMISISILVLIINLYEYQPYPPVEFNFDYEETFQKFQRLQNIELNAN